MTIAGAAGGLCLTIRSGDTRPRAPVEMTIDNDGLKRLRRYEDPEAGVAEEFLERRLGPGRSLALLSAPLAEARPIGWVISPSGGPEHGNLRRLETQLRGRLAAAGFPTLRIRPDLHPLNGALGEIDVSARVADANEESSPCSRRRAFGRRPRRDALRRNRRRSRRRAGRVPRASRSSNR